MTKIEIPRDERVRVLSLGAGVQSSTLAFLYQNGVLKPAPHFAIFADTQTEPKAVYDYLELLKKKITKFPIYTVTEGCLHEDVLSGGKFVTPPFFIKHPDGKRGMGRRQCTGDYKIKVIQKGVREILGYRKGTWFRHKVDMIIGISVDEIQRVKESITKWITNTYPLIDKMDWKRSDCKKYFSEQALPTPPRSACWMCPYRNDDEWIHLKENHPSEFKMAVEFDKKIRSLPKFHNENYLHISLKPLGEVEFKPKKTDDQLGLMSYMQNECEGMCGV